MRMTAFVALAIAAWSASLVAQENKPVPKDSVRVLISGCTKGYVLTAGRRSEDEPVSLEIPEGLHLRMNGPKKVMAEIKAHEGSMVAITGLMKKGQFMPDGANIGSGVRITGGSGPGGSSPIFIDVEGWRPIVGDCPSH